MTIVHIHTSRLGLSTLPVVSYILNERRVFYGRPSRDAGDDGLS